MLGYRVKYKGIVSELYVPSIQNGHVVILLAGLPSFLGKNDVVRFLYEKGYVVFQPFYSGSFDSDGTFSMAGCIRDVSVFLEMAKKKSHRELYYDKALKIKAKKVSLIGISFGSSVVALALENLKLSCAVLLSPVLTYSQKEVERAGFKGTQFDKQMNALHNLLRRAHKHTYRVKDYRKLKDELKGLVLPSPVRALSANRYSTPCLVLHGKDDSSLPWQLTQSLLKDCAAEKKCTFLPLEGVGHGISYYGRSDVLATLENFLSQA